MPSNISDFLISVKNGTVISDIPRVIAMIDGNNSFLFMNTLKYLLIISDNTSSIYRLFCEK